MKIAAAALALMIAAPAMTAPASAAAQSWTYPDQSRTWSSYSRYGHDYQGQRDRPGDYRCDAYWDRGRSDCDARWRDQRPFARSYASGYRRDGYYARGYDHGQGYGQGQAWPGAYGRPDLVYPTRGRSDGWRGYASQGTRSDGNRSAWCSARYRSYDPASGYYRAYSGRLIFCG